MGEFIAQWVKPFYLKVLHGNYTRLEGAELHHFITSVNRSLSEIDESVILRLLRSENWRAISRKLVRRTEAMGFI
jgi:hypothetical protein